MKTDKYTGVCLKIMENLSYIIYATIEEEGRWLNYNDLVIKRTKLPAHLNNGYMLFYLQI